MIMITLRTRSAVGTLTTGSRCRGILLDAHRPVLAVQP
jgi:hypothetical protein